jgi:hypothetical protein
LAGYLARGDARRKGGDAKSRQGWTGARKIVTFLRKGKPKK